MIKNEESLELFDEGSWLEKEKKRESMISAWDFDDANKLKYEHEVDCDVKQLATRHQFEHFKAGINNKKSLKNLNGNNIQSADITWFVIDFILLFVLIFINSFFVRINATHIVSVILFLSINPGIFIWLFIFKKFPPSSYSKAVFILVILLEIFCLYTGNSIGRF